MSSRESLRTTFLRTVAFVLVFIGMTAGKPQVASAPRPPVIVINSGYRLLIESDKGTIASFRSTFGVDRELLIPSHARLPLFKIEFLNDHSEFTTVTSSQAKEVNVSRSRDEDGQTIAIDYKEIGQLPVDARVTVRCPARDTLTYWNLDVTNGTTSWIGHIHQTVDLNNDRPVGFDVNKCVWRINLGRRLLLTHERKVQINRDDQSAGCRVRHTQETAATETGFFANDLRS